MECIVRAAAAILIIAEVGIMSRGQIRRGGREGPSREVSCRWPGNLPGEGNEYAVVAISTRISAKEALGLLDLVEEGLKEGYMSASSFMRDLLRARLGLEPYVPDYAEEGYGA